MYGSVWSLDVFRFLLCATFTIISSCAHVGSKLAASPFAAQMATACDPLKLFIGQLHPHLQESELLEWIAEKGSPEPADSFFRPADGPGKLSACFIKFRTFCECVVFNSGGWVLSLTGVGIFSDFFNGPDECQGVSLLLSLVDFLTLKSEL